ncbi:hypothetical protein [Natronorubrum sp. DTA7]|uniref:hypothetical protein n=1 Tax=Natronorubrum sp. DTA7 TaxID=3447016 RepID=UPI003F852557
MADDDWSSKRREVAYQEVRAVIDAQNGTMADIDDKAVRTVRFTAVLIGLLVTALQYAPEMFQQELFAAAIIALVISALVGIITYNESNLYVGPRGTYIEALTDNDFDGESWEEDLLETYAGMISENRDDIRWNALLLGVSLGTLTGGIIFATLSIAI